MLVSESSNSKVSDFEDTETNFETDEDHAHQNNTTSFETLAGITWNPLDPNQNHSGRRYCPNVIKEAPGQSAQAHRNIIKESIC